MQTRGSEMKKEKKKYSKPQVRKLDMVEVNAATCCRANMVVPDCTAINLTGGKTNKYNTQS